MKLPKTKTTPRNYQIEDALAIQDFGGKCLLGLQPGLGKSFICLLWMLMFLKKGPVVIVCPAIIKENWRREAIKHLGRKVVILDGKKPRELSSNPKAIYVINYDILGLPSRDGEIKTWTDAIAKIDPQLVVCDEAHKIKEPKARRSKACKLICRESPNVILVTGTPMLSRPIELWHLCHIIKPELFPSRLQFGLEFCLPADAPILMSDLKEKRIDEVKIGDSVIGWGRPNGMRRRLVHSKVLNVLVKKSPLQVVTLDDGTQFICTPDHKWATGQPSSKYEYLPAKVGRIGGAGLGTSSKVMKVMRGTCPVYKDTEDYMLGYIHGMFRGDGHCTKHEHRIYNPFKKIYIPRRTEYKVGCAMNDKAPMRRLSRYLTYFKIEHGLKVRSDGLLSLTKMVRKECYQFITTAVRDSDEWWAGFLGGIYDSEGCGPTIGQFKSVNPITRSMIEDGLRKFDFDIGGDEKQIWIRGGRHEFLRFWNIANPSARKKLIKSIMGSSGKLRGGGGAADGTNCPFVTKIEPLKGTHDVYTLTTETGNYVAYGCGSKNCDAKMTMFGWDLRGASNLEKLHGILTRNILIRRLKKDVLKQLPPKINSVVPLEFAQKARKEYDEAVNDFLKWLYRTRKKAVKDKAVMAYLRAERLVKLGYLCRLVGDLKLPMVIEWVKNFLEGRDEKILVGGNQRHIMEKLTSSFNGQAVLIYGKMNRHERQCSIDRFNSDRSCRVLFGNVQAAGVGWSCSSASNVAFAELPWVPGELEQFHDRCEGIGRGTGEPLNIYHLLANNTIDLKISETLSIKQQNLNLAIDGKHEVEDGADVYDQWIEYLEKNQ